MGNVTELGDVHEDITCRVELAGMDGASVRVASFAGREELSTLFRYELEVATPPELVPSLTKALGGAASFVLEQGGAFVRGVHGILTEVLPDGAHVGERQARTRLVVEPRLASLCHSGGFRIFQGKTVADIVGELVRAERIAVAWRVRPELAAREYCTQADESDFAFLARLAADEGAHFFFEHTGTQTTVVFTNDPRGFHPIAGDSATLSFRDVGGAATGEHVRTIARAVRVRPGAVEHRDYDFTRPSAALVARAEVTSSGEANTPRREWRDYPGGFLDPDGAGAQRARQRLEQLRADAEELTGTATTLRLAAGAQFSLVDHPDAGFNGKLTITGVELRGRVAGAFEQGTGGASSRAEVELTPFRAVRADVPLRPKALAKPLARLQTARVSGDGDPHVDETGRIHVQFRWDREGKADAHSSCWVRAMTPVAHGDEGFWQAHRGGSEVLVDFLDGDVDRPVVLGALYNGEQGQAHKLPGGASRASWKVRGIPGGVGFNEIALEAQAGSEQILVHAQRDLVATVLRSHTETIGENQTSTVGAQQSIRVGKDRKLTVKGDESTSIGVDQTIAVGGARSTEIGADDATEVDGHALREVALTDTLLVMGVRTLTTASEIVNVWGAREKNVGGGDVTNVAGDRRALVLGDESVKIAGQRVEKVEGPATCEVEKAIVVTSKESYELQVGDSALLSLNKDGDVEIKSGAASILLKKSGDILIKGKNVVVEADSDANVRGSNVVVKGSSKTAIN